MTSTVLNHAAVEAPPDDIAAALAGDRAAFGRLYAQYHPMVYKFAYFRTGKRQQAEDIAQQTFVRALTRLETFHWTGKDIGAWFLTIARNLIADYFKSSTYQRELLTDASPHEGGTAAHPVVTSAATAYIMSWEETVVRRFLKMLNPEQHECLTLRYLDGLSVRETAERMGKNEGAIKALQYRATMSMRRMMREAGNPLGYPLPR